MTALMSQIHTLYGPAVEIAACKNVGGGCINETGTLHLTNGETLFLKKNTLAMAGMFDAEALGLQALQTDGGPRVPSPIAAFKDHSHQYLLLEYLAPGTPDKHYWDTFGQQLAHLHRTVRNRECGFVQDNFIGATPQFNTWTPTWVAFFRHRRLAPQVQMAQRQLGPRLVRQLEQLMDRLDRFMEEPDGPASILHGDLWTGNAMVGPRGEPVVIDPATYFGHREADIAMTQLFGRFDRRFYAAYSESWPLSSGWQQRMSIYNLYHMLNHVNLFGSGYVGSVSDIVNEYL